MNRHTKRAEQSVQRKANVSVGFIQSQLAKAQTEMQQLRNVLFSLAKEQGRMRFQKATLDALSEEDGIDATLVDGAYIITYIKRSAQDAGPKESA